MLKTVDVDFTYPSGPRALSNVSMSIHERERLAILGANGCGKSTLLMLLNGTLRPTGGEVQLDGTAVSYRRRPLATLRQRVGLVLQDPEDQLFSASVFEDVSFGPLNLGLGEDEARRRVEETLHLLGISELQHRPAHLLSYGQRKRVAIAGIAAMRPAIMLLDEPLAGLDPAGRAAVVGALERLRQTGTTIAMTTHDVDLAAAWADRVVLLASGRVINSGPTMQLLGDSEACREAAIEQPEVLKVAATLVALGILPEGAAPRSFSELHRHLDASTLDRSRIS